MNLLVHEVGPESGGGPAIGIGRKQPILMAIESFVDVLDDDGRLADGSVTMEEHRYLLVHRIGSQQEGALLWQILWELLILDPFEAQSNVYSLRERALPEAQQSDLLSFPMVLGHSQI